jgi:hypothetical protein
MVLANAIQISQLLLARETLCAPQSRTGCGAAQEKTRRWFFGTAYVLSPCPERARSH